MKILSLKLINYFCIFKFAGILDLSTHKINESLKFSFLS